MSRVYCIYIYHICHFIADCEYLGHAVQVKKVVQGGKVKQIVLSTSQYIHFLFYFLMKESNISSFRSSLACGQSTFIANEFAAATAPADDASAATTIPNAAELLQFRTSCSFTCSFICYITTSRFTGW